MLYNTHIWQERLPHDVGDAHVRVSNVRKCLPHRVGPALPEGIYDAKTHQFLISLHCQIFLAKSFSLINFYAAHPINT